MSEENAKGPKPYAIDPEIGQGPVRPDLAVKFEEGASEGAEGCGNRPAL